MTRSGGTQRRKFAADAAAEVVDAKAATERQAAREAARAETQANIERLKVIAADSKTPPADRIRAMRLLGELAGMVGRERPDEVALFAIPVETMTREELALRAYHEAQALVERASALRAAIANGETATALALFDRIVISVPLQANRPPPS